MGFFSSLTGKKTPVTPTPVTPTPVTPVTPATPTPTPTPTPAPAKKTGFLRSLTGEPKAKPPTKVDTMKGLKLSGHGFGNGGTTVLLKLKSGSIVSGGYDNALKIWNDVLSKEIVSGYVSNMYAIPEDLWLLKGFPPKSGDAKNTSGHTDVVICAAELPDGRVVSGSKDKTLCIWNTKTGMCERVLVGHKSNVTCLAVLPDGRIVSGSWDGSLRIWDAATGNCEHVLEGHTDWVSCLVVLPDGRIVSGSYDNSLRVWTATGACERVLKGHTGYVSCLAVMPGGRRVVSGSGDSSLRVWDADTGECERKLTGLANNVLCLLVLADGRVVGGSRDMKNNLRVWETNKLPTERLMGSTTKSIELKGHPGDVHCLAELPDGRLVSGSSGNSDTLLVWNMTTGACEYTLTGFETVMRVIVLPTNHIVCGGPSSMINIWKLPERPITGGGKRARTHSVRRNKKKRLTKKRSTRR